MIHNLPVTLAVDLFELIIYGIFGIIALGSMIANWFKQNIEKQKREQRMARGQGGDSGGAVSLDDLAARRREELRRAAQQRQTAGGSVSGGGASGGGEPGNLTMAQRIERARAQEAYRKRAEALRQQQAAAGAPPQQQRPSAPKPDAAAVLAERRRREMEEAERARQQREAQVALERRRREAAVRQHQEQTRAAQQQAQRQRPPQQRRPSRPAPMVMVEPEPEVRTLHVLDEVHDADKRRRSGAVAKPMRRMAASKAARGGGIRGRQLGILLTNAQSFRQALILKEVLDKPLSMRQPEADRFYA